MTRSIPFHQVDAFADAVFGGNPAGVCLLDDWLPDATMRAIAAENNLSETAFLTPGGPATYGLRWFTPQAEVPLCGHATLASGAVVLDRIAPDWPSVAFQTRYSGTLTVRRAPPGYAMDLPAYNPLPCDPIDELAEALGAAPVADLACSATDIVLVELADAQTVRTLSPDIAGLKRLDRHAFVVTAPGGPADGVDIVSRVFAPSVGIDEDPVTGAAHCLLVPYWAGRLGRQRLTAEQASQRGGHLVCTLEGQRVVLQGTAAFYLEGTLRV